MADQLLLQNAEQYVRRHFATKVKAVFTYHNITHTEGVVNAAIIMGSYYQLPEEEMMALQLAAWFHDTGFSQGKPENHEAESQRIATNYLKQQEAPGPLIEKVSNCIAATIMPQSPKSLTDQILSDADLYHLGTRDFASQNKLLRQEIAGYTGEKVRKNDWQKSTIKFLQQHKYFTEYARTRLGPVKQENLQQLLESEKSKQESQTLPKQFQMKDQAPGNTNVDGQAPEKPKKKKKQNRTGRGVGTMFRIMSNNHINLSKMADSKANIMISVNTIVLSILVTALFHKLQFYPQFIIPTIILCTVCLSAIVFAILSTRPNVNRGTFNPDEIHHKKINLLFFGNFFKMELADYDWAMKEMMQDEEYLYGSMIKDIYFLGIVLAKKYRFLRISYNIFMIGIVVSIVAFIIAFSVTKN